jgi:hypothetical protein
LQQVTRHDKGKAASTQAGCFPDLFSQRGDTTLMAIMIRNELIRVLASGLAVVGGNRLLIFGLIIMFLTALPSGGFAMNTGLLFVSSEHTMATS